VKGQKREDSVGRKTKKHESCYARQCFVKNVLYTNNPVQNSGVVSLLQNYDVMPTDSIPSGYWAWVQMQKERFLAHWRSKLHQRGDDLF
jgi:hypothetical protein